MRCIISRVRAVSPRLGNLYRHTFFFLRIQDLIHERDALKTCKFIIMCAKVDVVLISMLPLLYINYHKS